MNIIMLAILSCILALILKEYKSSYAYLCVLASAVIIVLVSLEKFEEIGSFVTQLQQHSGVTDQYFGVILKVVGIGLLGEFSISMCQEQQHATLAGAIDLFCKVSVLVLSLPIFKDVLNMLGELLK